MANTLSRQERETILRFSEDPHKPVVFETYNKRRALRLIERGATVVRTTTSQGVISWTLQFPRSWFRWPGPPRKRPDLVGKPLPTP